MSVVNGCDTNNNEVHHQNTKNTPRKYQLQACLMTPGLLPDLSEGFPFPIDLPDLLGGLGGSPFGNSPFGQMGEPAGATGAAGAAGGSPLPGFGDKAGKEVKSLFGDLGILDDPDLGGPLMSFGFFLFYFHIILGYPWIC